jgi:hypothetical protein
VKGPEQRVLVAVGDSALVRLLDLVGQGTNSAFRVDVGKVAELELAPVARLCSVSA